MCALSEVQVFLSARSNENVWQLAAYFKHFYTLSHKIGESMGGSHKFGNAMRNQPAYGLGYSREFDLPDKYARMSVNIAKSRNRRTWQQDLLDNAEERENPDRPKSSHLQPVNCRTRGSEPADVLLLNEMNFGELAPDYDRWLSEANVLRSGRICYSKAQNLLRIYDKLFMHFHAEAISEKSKISSVSKAEICASKAVSLLENRSRSHSQDAMKEWQMRLDACHGSMFHMILGELDFKADGSPSERCEMLGKAADHLEQRSRELFGDSKRFGQKLSELRLEKAGLHLAIAKGMIQGGKTANEGFAQELSSADDEVAKAGMCDSTSMRAKLVTSEARLLHAWQQILKSGAGNENVRRLFDSIISGLGYFFASEHDTSGAKLTPVSDWFAAADAQEHFEQCGLKKAWLHEKDGFRYHSSNSSLLAIKKQGELFRIYKVGGQLISNAVRAKIMLAQTQYLKGFACMRTKDFASELADRLATLDADTASAVVNMHAKNSASRSFLAAFHALGGDFVSEMIKSDPMLKSNSSVEFNPATGIASENDFGQKRLFGADSLLQLRIVEGERPSHDFKAYSALFGETQELRYSALCAYAVLSENDRIKEHSSKFNPENIEQPKFSDPYSMAIKAEYKSISETFWLLHSALSLAKE